MISSLLTTFVPAILLFLKIILVYFICPTVVVKEEEKTEVVEKPKPGRGRKKKETETKEVEKGRKRRGKKQNENNGNLYRCVLQLLDKIGAGDRTRMSYHTCEIKQSLMICIKRL